MRPHAKRRSTAVRPPSRVGRTAIRRLCSGTAVSLCLTVGPAVAAAQQTARPPATIDPKAVEALKRMGAYLRTLKQFGMQAEGTRDQVLENGQKIQFGGTVSYLVRVPNGMRVEIKTDRKDRLIFYDGRTLTQYAPRMHYYSSVPAPSTIGVMLDSASRRFQLDFPLADLFLWGTPRDGVKDLTSATYVGPSKVEGADCDHYAFRQEDADWQIWIQSGNQPLPRKMVITTTSLPQEPQYAVTMTWDLSPKIDDSTFAFTPPPDAKKIVMAATIEAPPMAIQRIAKEKK